MYIELLSLKVAVKTQKLDAVIVAIVLLLVLVFVFVLILLDLVSLA